MKGRFVQIVVTLALLTFATDLGSREAKADGAKPRAAVAVSIAEGTDDFVEAYLFEVAASVLRSDGYDVAPPYATTAQLRDLGQSAAECAADEACVIELARRTGTPTILFIEVSPVPRDGDGESEGVGEQVRLVVRGATVRVGAASISTPTEAEGTETAMGVPVQQAAERLTDTTPPCHLELAPGALSVVVRIDGGPEQRAFPLYVEPGAHTLRVSAPRRAPHEGRFECSAGKRYRMGVR